MTLGAPYERCVFVNCPFDEDYRPILEAILFCLIDCDLIPRIATERIDSGEARLAKILELIHACQYSIHDLSHVQADKAGDYARLNMPFELGIDYGVGQAKSNDSPPKRLLVIAAEQYKYQRALSDIAGWDIQSHGNDYSRVFRVVRNWLASLPLPTRAAARIEGDYLGFQEWNYERLLADGWAERDIQERSTPDVLDSMHSWMAADRPMTF